MIIASWILIACSHDCRAGEQISEPPSGHPERLRERAEHDDVVAPAFDSGGARADEDARTWRIRRIDATRRTRRVGDGSVVDEVHVGLVAHDDDAASAQLENDLLEVVSAR